MTIKRVLIGVGLLAVAMAAGLVGWCRMHGYALGPDDTRFVYSDLERFGELSAGLNESPDSASILALYLEEGSRGLASYAKLYALSGQRIADAVRAYPACYADPGELIARVKATEPEIRRALLAYEELYPRAIHPPTYFLVGNACAGGANSSAGVLIAAELYGRPGTPQAAREGEAEDPGPPPYYTRPPLSGHA